MTWFTYLHIAPVAKGRPKFSMRGGYPRAYTPSETVIAEYEIKRHLVKEWKKQPLEGAIKTTVIFYMPIPKSTSKKRYKTILGEPHIKKPDKDNLEKLLNDAGNGIIWKDDAQIWHSDIKKVYSNETKIYLEIEYER